MKNLTIEGNKKEIFGGTADELTKVGDMLGGILPEEEKTPLKIHSDASDKNEKIEVCKYCGKPKEKKELPTVEGRRPLTIWLSTCDCEEKEEQRKANRVKRVARIKHLREVYKKCGFTRRQLGKRLKNLTCEHKDELLEWTRDFKPRKSKGMYLYGGVGNGKTTAGSSTAKELVSLGFEKVYFFTMAEYLNKMQQTYSAKSPISFDDLMQKWFDADAVFIDDFGREKYSEKRLENVFLFFDGLYSNCTTFFVISNPENMLRVKEIPEFEAIFDRFSETLDKVIFKKKSMRRNDEK